MAVNFYGNIEKLEDGAKNTTKIVISGSSNNMSKLYKAIHDLKVEGTVNILIESAQIKYAVQQDVETGEPQMKYVQRSDGEWYAEEVGTTGLDLGMANTVSKDFEVSADIVDDFLLAEKYQVDEFDPKPIIYKLSEGYNLDEIAKEAGMASIEIINKLNEARQKFAPYAVTWAKNKESEK